MSNSESKFNNYCKSAKTAYKEGRYQDALWNLQKALGKSRKLKDSKGEAEVLKNIGWIYDCKFYNYDKALEHYEESLVISRELKVIKLEGKILKNIGTVYYKLHSYDKSLEYYGNALKISRVSEEPKLGRLLECNTLVNIGIVYFSLYNYDKALWYFEKSLKISGGQYSSSTEYKDFRSAEWQAFYGFGICYLVLGKHDKALGYFKGSLNICTELKDSSGEAFCQVCIGLVYTSLSYYDKALECFDKSLKIISRVSTGLYFVIAKWQVFCGLGRYYIALGKNDKALDYFKRSLNISRNLKDPSGEVLCQNNIGLVYLSIGKYEKAIECFKIALAMSKDFRDTAIKGSILLSVGIIYSIWHEQDTAVEYLNKSIKIFKESQMRENEGWVYGLMGNIYTELDKYDKAIGFYENSLAIGMECKYPEMIYTISTNYAEVYEDYLKSESEYLNKAFDLYEKAIEASLFIKDNVKELLAREYLLARHVDAFEGYIRTGHSLAEQSADVAVKSDYYTKIFEAAEKSKARTVVDLLANIKIKYKDKSSEKLASELEERKRLIQQSCKKSDEYGIGTHLGIIRHTAPVYTPQLRASALEDCKKAADVFERRTFADCAMRSPVMKSFNEILGVLKDDPDTVVLEYCEVGNDEYILYVLNHTGFLINPVRLKLPRIKDTLFDLEGNKDKGELREFFKEISAEGYSFTDLKGHYRFFQNSDEGVVFPTNILTSIEQLQTHAEKLGISLPYNRFLEISQHYLDKSLCKWGDALLPNEVFDRIDEVCQAGVKMPHLLIVPDALLYNIPFHALFVRNSDDNILPMKNSNANNGKCYLIDKYDISYNVSMTAQWICRQEITPGRKEENYVYFGGADYSEAPRLPSYEYEIGSIERRANNRHGEKTASSRFSTFTGDNVTLKNFKNKSDKYTNHVVTVHGAFIPDAPMKSYFLFLDDKGDESKYTLEDMIGDEELIFKNSHLFWAGACKLGMSAVTDGKDIIGLVRTLMQKSVPSVVMGLTNLDDTATALLLDNFCQVYDGKNKAKGLSEAVRQLRKCTLGDLTKKIGVSIDELKEYFNTQSDEFVFDNPYFWMPFVLYGDFR